MRRLILTLGMHRSGTSLVAAAQECLGVEFGERSKWKGPDNPKGFYELPEMIAINDALLAERGLRWDSAEEMPSQSYPLSNPTIEAAADIILACDENFPVAFGLKEPRLCRLLPVWKQILATYMDIPISVVFAIRHPSSVAMSLAKRNSMSIERGLDLWCRYVSESFDNIDPAWPKVVVEYDRMLESPQSEIERIGFHLGLPVDQAKVDHFIAEHIDQNMRHERLRDPLPDEIETLWRRVKALAA